MSRWSFENALLPICVKDFLVSGWFWNEIETENGSKCCADFQQSVWDIRKQSLSFIFFLILYFHGFLIFLEVEKVASNLQLSQKVGKINLIGYYVSSSSPHPRHNRYPSCIFVPLFCACVCEHVCKWSETSPLSFDWWHENIMEVWSLL